jgi:hypothetical protein
MKIYQVITEKLPGEKQRERKTPIRERTNEG